MSAAGRVFLVGAGPGDPGLLTLRAAALLRDCDVIFYDYLVNPLLLDLCAGPGVERVYVGKTGGHKGADERQEEIHGLLIERARRGERVVRLKGGDPFVFGRGGEEAEALRAAGVGFEVVPGVTSAIAAPAYAGIPVTHRDCNTALAIVTGHEDPRRPEGRTSWEALARLANAGGTLLILMGSKNLSRNMGFLQEHGVPPETPAALVRWGTLPRQRALVAQVGTLAAEAEAAQVGPPAVCVVGGVAALQGSLSWYVPGPLEGRRVLLTRADEASEEALRALGAAPVLWPTLEVRPPLDPGPLSAALGELGRFDWLAVSSANGARAVLEGLWARGLDARALGGVRVACVGEATAAALAQGGVRAELVPARATGAALAEALLGQGAARVLVAQAEAAQPALVEGLRGGGAAVEAVIAYRAQALPAPPGALSLLLEGEVDAALFASPSALRAVAEALPAGRVLGEVLGRSAVVCIGPTTAAEAAALGVRVDVIPAATSAVAMVEALAVWGAQEGAWAIRS